jgi:hypothetical protein
LQKAGPAALVRRASRGYAQHQVNISIMKESEPIGPAPKTPPLFFLDKIIVFDHGVSLRISTK